MPAPDFQVTTDGLVGVPESSSSLTQINWAAAAGTADAITAAYSPAVTALTDGLILGFRASGPNTITTPTFSPDGLTARTITRSGGAPLRAEGIPAANAEMLVRYNLANTRWELLNPFDVQTRHAVAGGSADALTATYAPAVVTFSDGLLLSLRAASANTSTAPTFSPNGLTARAITKAGGLPLIQGDIAGSTHELLLRYNSANTRWELLNPAGATPEVYQTITADQSGGNVNTAQPWFPTQGGVTLPVGLYEFEGLLLLSRSAGTTSHTTSLVYGGTATVNQIVYEYQCGTGDVNPAAGLLFGWINVAAATQVKAASTSATEQAFVWVRGEFNVTVAGTFIPQFQYSAAPGGAPSIKAGTMFRARRVKSQLGAWA